MFANPQIDTNISAMKQNDLSPKLKWFQFWSWLIKHGSMAVSPFQPTQRGSVNNFTIVMSSLHCPLVFGDILCPSYVHTPGKWLYNLVNIVPYCP